MNRFSLKKLARAAVIAAAYALLTVVWPFSIGPLQCRLSEALCVLPYCMPESVWGLFCGCLLGNLLSGADVLDIIFGSLTTLLAAAVTAWMGKKKLPPYLAPLPAVVLNAVCVGAILCFVYQYGLSYPVAMLQVGGGEAISVYALGLPLLFAMLKSPYFAGKENDIKNHKI